MKRTNPFDNQNIQSNNNNQNLNNNPPSINQTKKLPTQYEQNQNYKSVSQLSNYETDSIKNDSIKLEYEQKKIYNCKSEYIRPSLKILPNTETLRNTISLPIGLNVSPMVKNLVNDIPIINYGELNIPRCEKKECRAYFNPFVTFEDYGNIWVCNFCKNRNTTEKHFFYDLNDNGERKDKNKKIELCNGSYEFIANKQYYKDHSNPCKANFIFVIDICQNSFNSGFLNSILESLKYSISNDLFYNYDKFDIKVAFITFDNSVQFYCINEKNNQPQMLCVTDEEIFLPTIRENLFFSLKSNKDKILNLIELIQNIHTSNPILDSNAIFKALDAVYLLGKELGSQVLLFSASNIISNLNIMNSPSLKFNKKEEEYYQSSENKQIGRFGIKLTNQQISIDLYVTATKYINLLALNQLCDYTNGNIFFYKKYDINLHYKSLFTQITNSLINERAFEAVLRIRFSHGYYIKEFLTPVLLYNKDLFVFPTNDCEQKYQILIGMLKEDEVDKNNKYTTMNDDFVYIQSSLLYSYGDGSRRIRIHNLCLPVSNNIFDIVNSIDSEAEISVFLKRTIDQIYRQHNLSNAIAENETLFKKLFSYISNYSPYKIDKNVSNELINFPLYFLGLMKQKVFCINEVERNFDIDLSNYIRFKLLRLSPEDIIPFIYPYFYNLNSLIDDNSIGNYNEDNSFNLPPISQCSINYLDNNSVYLIDNGFLLILFIRENANKEILNLLFGTDNLNELNYPINENSIFDNESTKNFFKERIINIIEYIRYNKSFYQNLIFSFEGTSLDNIVKECLIEDNFCQWYRYDYNTFNKKLWDPYH